jgi:AP2-associated kinase
MSDSSQDGNNLSSNVDFLRAMEEEETTRRKEKRSSSRSKHAKRASLPSISLSNTKSLLAGKFGNAFRRFEANTSVPPRTPSPLSDHDRKDLTPITGSEVTGERSDDGHIDDEDVAPETKRELERRQLAQVERRVEAAAAEYRKRLADRDLQNAQGSRGGAGGLPINRAATIQNKVKILLDENHKTPLPKTAEALPQTRRFESEAAGTFGPTIMNRKPVPTSQSRSAAHATSESLSKLSHVKPRSAALEQHGPTAVGPRPSAPPKPQKLRKPPSPLAGRGPQPSNEPNMNGDDWEANFSKRYPSLSGLEMVETEIDMARPAGLRSKEL